MLVSMIINAEGVSVRGDFGSEPAGFHETGEDIRGSRFEEVASPGTVVSMRLATIDGSDPGTMGPGDSLELGFYERAD